MRRRIDSKEDRNGCKKTELRSLITDKYDKGKQKDRERNGKQYRRWKEKGKDRKGIMEVDK